MHSFIIRVLFRLRDVCVGLTVCADHSLVVMLHYIFKAKDSAVFTLLSTWLILPFISCYIVFDFQYDVQLACFVWLVLR